MSSSRFLLPHCAPQGVPAPREQPFADIFVKCSADRWDGTMTSLLPSWITRSSHIVGTKTRVHELLGYAVMGLPVIMEMKFGVLRAQDEALKIARGTNVHFDITSALSIRILIVQSFPSFLEEPPSRES